ncbi:hypothetical protein ACIPW4_04090 [Pseudomonas sp. NPDC089996]|uniref:hypothetical protein n=1 Tax=Pseudomonas sp. NPDC089996 TaxID=3364474 RepID=UPI0038071BCE
MYKFIKTTIAGGVLFILPLLVVVILIEKAIHILTPPLQKVMPLFSGYTLVGGTSLTVLALLALAFICFLAGLLARTAIAARTLGALEDRILGNLPGYQLIKDATSRFAGLENMEGARVGMIAEGEGFRFGLVLETQEQWLLIYLPDGGPAGATAGEVRAVPHDQVTLTDIPWLSVVACLRRGGRGTLELMKQYL